MHDGHTAIGRSNLPLTHHALNIAASQHWALAIEPVMGLSVMFVEPPLEASFSALPFLTPCWLTLHSVLAGMACVSYLRFHSKVLHELASCGDGPNHEPQFARGFSSFLRASPKSRKGASLD
jgi:hypothetical protein